MGDFNLIKCFLRGGKTWVITSSGLCYSALTLCNAGCLANLLIRQIYQ